MNCNHTGWHYNESITKLQIAQQSSLESKSEFCDSLGTYSLTTKKGSSSDILINCYSSNVDDFFRNRLGHKNRLLISSAFPLGPKFTEFPPVAGLLNSGCVSCVVAAALRSSTLPPPRFFSHQLILFWGEVVHDYGKTASDEKLHRRRKQKHAEPQLYPLSPPRLDQYYCHQFLF